MYFAFRCAEASCGGDTGYDDPAWHLAIHIYHEHPLDISWAEWKAEVIRVNDLCRIRDDDGVWKWFRYHYPRCMALVPSRRKRQFLTGIYRAYDQERMI
jgi:hypothetical protein